MTIIEATTPTGMKRGVMLYRETVLNRIRLEVINDPCRTTEKVYAQVNLTIEQAQEFRKALDDAIAEGGER